MGDESRPCRRILKRHGGGRGEDGIARVHPVASQEARSAESIQPAGTRRESSVPPLV